MQREHRHQQLHPGRDEDRERVGLDPVVAVSAAAGRQQDDDHEVPDRRRDRGDREAVVGLEDADEQARQAEQQDDREEDLREAAVTPLTPSSAGPRNSGMITSRRG